MSKPINLLTPGPTPVPERVLKAMSECNLHHRSEEFSAVLKNVWEGLQSVFQTKHPVYLLASSGTGGMEAAVSNCFSCGDKVITVDGGKFGQRWGEIAKANGLEVITISVEWGKAVNPDEIKDLLSKNPDVKGVLFQACETSTGVMHPVKEIAEVTRANSDALVICDGITGTGVFSIPADEWGIDVVVSGSQKAFMLPPGLAFLSLSPRAWERVEKTSSGRYYFDLRREKKAFEKGTTAFTPAISLILGLRESLLMMKEEGLQSIFDKTENLAKVTRETFLEMGLSLLSPDAPSPSLTAVYAPEGIDTGKLVKKLRADENVWIAGGQDHLKGKIFRVSHMGAVTPEALGAGISAIQTALNDLGASITKENQFSTKFEGLGR